MVTQPAYLRNLKDYARRRIENIETEAAELTADYSSESDRGAIILVATVVEDSLEMRILNKLPGLQADETSRKRMFEHDGLISSFSKRIEMAYAMGIIDADYRKKIDLIREIRNACAHSRFPLSMKQPALREACKALMLDMWDDLKDHEPSTIRTAFLVKCTFVSYYILTGKKVEGAKAQYQLFLQFQAAQAKAGT